MPETSDPRVFFAGVRTLLAWQRSGLALMAFGFVIERFSLFLTLLRLAPESSPHHLFSLVVGVVLILLGAAVEIASTVAFRRFVRELPRQDVPSGSWVWLGSTINLVVAVIGILLAGFLVLSGL
ncbi:MAG: YidH family protein [Steroidobacteraceae bacterium]